MDVQTFEARSTTDMRGWLRLLCGRADAVVPGWEERAATATRVVELVTCSSLVRGQRDRTVVVFCS